MAFTQKYCKKMATNEETMTQKIGRVTRKKPGALGKKEREGEEAAN